MGATVACASSVVRINWSLSDTQTLFLCSFRADKTSVAAWSRVFRIEFSAWRGSVVMASRRINRWTGVVRTFFWWTSFCKAYMVLQKASALRDELVKRNELNKAGSKSEFRSDGDSGDWKIGVEDFTAGGNIGRSSQTGESTRNRPAFLDFGLSLDYNA